MNRSWRPRPSAQLVSSFRSSVSSDQVNGWTSIAAYLCLCLLSICCWGVLYSSFFEASKKAQRELLHLPAMERLCWQADSTAGGIGENAQPHFRNCLAHTHHRLGRLVGGLLRVLLNAFREVEV